jgi:triacylglycerol lipase
MNIILVHGILGFSRIGVIDYFRGVAEHFRANGLLVLAPQLDPTQGIAFRGDQLRDQIQMAFTSGTLDPGQKTHIIAHSMGGLDSRYMLSPANPHPIQVSIRSLTTVGTPHLGSPIADVVDDPSLLSPFPHLPFATPMSLLEPILNILGVSENGLRDLRVGSCRTFSAKYIDNPKVSYFSCAGTGHPNFPQTSAPFMLFHQYISAATGQQNDGLVSISSANWGTFDPVTWPGDHVEEVGYDLTNLVVPPAFQCIPKYDQIVRNVAAL